MPLPAELQPQVVMGVLERMGSFANPFERYFSRTPNPVEGNILTYDVVSFQRQMTRLTARNGRAPRTAAPTRNMVTYEAPTLKGSIEAPRGFKDWRAAGSLSTSAREQVISNNLRQLRLDFDRRVAWLQAQWLTFGGLLTSAGAAPNTANATAGVVYLDYAELLASSPMAVTLGITATHADHAVAASWATTTTDIRGDLDAARGLCERESGVSPRLVLLNSLTMQYVLANAACTNSVDFNNQLMRFGATNEADLLGYHWRVINDQWPVDTETMNDTAGMEYYIPTNMVILMSEDNTAAGRQMFDCSPSDNDAPAGARGMYAWVDREAEHPHGEIPGIEYTGGPSMSQVDAHYVICDVTDVTP